MWYNIITRDEEIVRHRKEKEMKIVNYQGEKIRLHKGETLATVSYFWGGRWSKPEIDLCIIKKHFFRNGNEKRGEFDVVQELKTIQKGYHAKSASYHGKNFCEIATAEK